MAAAALLGPEPDRRPRALRRSRQAVKDLDWSLVPTSGQTSGWPMRFFKMSKAYHVDRRLGRSGLGYGLPASIGGAHANKQSGGSRSPLRATASDVRPVPCGRRHATRSRSSRSLHNNRAITQEVIARAALSNRRRARCQQRKDFGPIGTRIENRMSISWIAKSMGW